jgi:hypothetical protein
MADTGKTIAIVAVLGAVGAGAWYIWNKSQKITLNLSSDPVTEGTTSASPSKDTYEKDESVEVSASPFPLCSLKGWKIDGIFSGEENPITIKMDKSHNVCALFISAGQSDNTPGSKENGYILTLGSEPNGLTGTLSANPSKPRYVPGEEVVITANPTTVGPVQYYLASWKIDNKSINALGNSYKITMNGNHTVAGVFESGSSAPVGNEDDDSGDGGSGTVTTPKYYLQTQLDYTGGKVTVSPTPPYFSPGTRVTLRANPYTVLFVEYYLRGWYVDGYFMGPENPLVVEMDADHEVYADFAGGEGEVNPSDEYYVLNLASSPVSNGTVDAYPDTTTYKKGTVVTITASPFWLQSLGDWEIDGVRVGNNQNPIQLTMNADHNVVAIF